MGKLGEALSVERSRLFVGRDKELRYMQKWLTLQDAPTEVLFISGLGGIGKSALMLQLLNMAQQERVASIWLDGRVCTDTPGGFLESLNAFLIHHPLVKASPNKSIQAIIAEMAQRKLLLCIDNYEYIHKIEGWLREVFLSGLSANGLLVVLASRQDLSFNWKNDMAWQNRIRHIRLDPFTRREAQHYFTLRGLGKESAMERLISDSQGLPLAMALFVEHLRFPKQESAASALPISMQVSAEMLREVASSELKEVLDLLCILPYSDSKWLGLHLETPLSVVDLGRLTQFSFIRPTVGGLALHDVARNFLIEDFLQREPVRFQTQRRRIMEGLTKELKQAVGQDKKRIASVMLSACRDLFHLDSVSIFSANMDFMQMQPFRNSDLPHLHRLKRKISHTPSLQRSIMRFLTRWLTNFRRAFMSFVRLKGFRCQLLRASCFIRKPFAFWSALFQVCWTLLFPKRSIICGICLLRKQILITSYSLAFQLAKAIILFMNWWVRSFQT